MKRSENIPYELLAAPTSHERVALQLLERLLNSIFEMEPSDVSFENPRGLLIKPNASVNKDGLGGFVKIAARVSRLVDEESERHYSVDYHLAQA